MVGSIGQIGGPGFEPGASRSRTLCDISFRNGRNDRFQFESFGSTPASVQRCAILPPDYYTNYFTTTSASTDPWSYFALDATFSRADPAAHPIEDDPGRGHPPPRGSIWVKHVRRKRILGILPDLKMSFTIVLQFLQGVQ